MNYFCLFMRFSVLRWKYALKTDYFSFCAKQKKIPAAFSTAKQLEF